MTANALTRVRLKSFTAFEELDAPLGSALNVIVGENGAGKSHLLKLLYSTVAVAREAGSGRLASVPVEAAYAQKLMAVFRPDALGRLVTRRRGRDRAEVDVETANPFLEPGFSFSSNSRSEVRVPSVNAVTVPADLPVFLPTRELLTLYPGFVSLYESRYLEFDETFRDTCLLLGQPLLRGPREAGKRSVMVALEAGLGGTVEDDNGRFYLKVQGKGRFEMPLVAEGLRKLATVARLVATGALLDSGYLFWDEPEANLNPRTIRNVAAAIVALSLNGVQVFIATHSLFLLREIEILLAQPENKTVAENTKFLGLGLADGVIQSRSSDELLGLGSFAALEEDIEQADRFLTTAVV